MRVLMLGWEFPPHISGGLGTACLGLTQGLSNDGVEVLFVVPRAFGDEDDRYVQVLGADGVDLPAPPKRAAAGRGPAATGPESGETPPLAGGDIEDELARWAAEVPLAGGSGKSLGRMLEHVQLLALDSRLQAYLDEAGYAERWAASRAQGAEALAAEDPHVDAAEAKATGRDSGPAGERPSPPPEAAESAAMDAIDAAIPEGAARPRSTETEQARLAFSGGYGPGLLEEVSRYARVVAELARRESFDLIHAHDWMTYPAGLLAAAVSGRPLVAHLHASEYDRSGENPNPRVREIERLGLAGADRVVCVSHFLSATVRKHYGVPADKIRVVHNAVTLAEEAEAFHVDRSADLPIVLYLGRVTYQKGPEYFLEAARRVIEIEPRVKFVISGSGDLLPGVIERAASLGLARHLHFTGFLRGRDVERMYAMADVYVMPSVSEPFGISPLEALALDVPVIVSRQSGVSEVVQSALKFDFWDVQDLANKILAVLRRPALRRQLASEGGDEARHMRWDIRGERMHQIYRELAP